MQLVQYAPERTEANRPFVLVVRQQAVRDPGVLELGQEHLACRRVGERRLLDREDVVDLLGRTHADDVPHDGHLGPGIGRTGALSLAISASGRLT